MSIEDLPQTKEELIKKIKEIKEGSEGNERNFNPFSSLEKKNLCGQCAAYKTSFCSFSDFEEIIKKADCACSDFCPDRHLRGKRLKIKVVERRVGKR